MRKKTGKLVVMLLIGVIVMLTVGCEEENLSQTSKGVRKSRLIAMENKKLQSDLTECKKEIERLEEKIKGTNESSTMLISTIIMQNQELEKENKELKKKLQQLKKI